MLILTRKPGESLYIGDTVKVTIVEIKGNQIRVGIDAPSTLRIYREEIYLQILEENKKAAEAVTDSSLDELTGSWMGPQQGGASAPRPAKMGVSSVMTRRVEAPQVSMKRRKKRRDDEPSGSSSSESGDENE